MEIVISKLGSLLGEWQNEVQFDLSSSGVDAMELHELVSLEEFSELHRTVKLRYIQTNGPLPLREAIRRRYPGADVKNIHVANGSCEVLMLMLWKFCEPSYELVQLSPNYPLIGSLARSFGAIVKNVPLVREKNWAVDLDAFEDTISPSTKMIYISNPNNPTGSILTDVEMEAIVRIASKVNAWLIADEIYHGAELSGEPTCSFWGRYDKLLVTSGLSKTYGLAGLRLGWVVGPEQTIAEIRHYHDYTTTTTTAISAELARLALEPEREARIFERTREISHRNYQVLYDWIAEHSKLLTSVPTKIGGLAFFGYQLDIPSDAFAKQIIQEVSVLLAPGSYFGVEHHFRIGYSVPYLREGLNRLGEVFNRYNS